MSTVPDTTPVTISTYSGDPAEAQAFRDLNLAWIESLFSIEDADRAILDDPDGHIVARGGTLLVARAGDEIIGCLAVVPTEPGVAELVKMTVSERARGRGTARALIEAAIDAARHSGVRRLTLETNHVLVPAVRLYESVGFQHIAPEDREPSEFSRADVAMELTLLK